MPVLETTVVTAEYRCVNVEELDEESYLNVLRRDNEVSMSMALSSPRSVSKAIELKDEEFSVVRRRSEEKGRKYEYYNNAIHIVTKEPLEISRVYNIQITRPNPHTY